MEEGAEDTSLLMVVDVVIIDCVAEILIPPTVLQEFLMVDKWLLPAYHRLIL